MTPVLLVEPIPFLGRPPGGLLLILGVREPDMVLLWYGSPFWVRRRKLILLYYTVRRMPVAPAALRPWTRTASAEFACCGGHSYLGRLALLRLALLRPAVQLWPLLLPPSSSPCLSSPSAAGGAKSKLQFRLWQTRSQEMEIGALDSHHAYHIGVSKLHKGHSNGQARSWEPLKILTSPPPPEQSVGSVRCGAEHLYTMRY